MGFEQFSRTKGGHGLKHQSSNPAVSLTRAGRISFNSLALKSLGQPEYISLWFDRERNLVGLMGEDSSGAEAYKVSGITSSGGGLIDARAFLTFYGIPYGGRVKVYILKPEGGMFVFNPEESEA